MVNSTYVAEYEVRKRNKINIRFTPIEQCLVVGCYIVWPINLLEIIKEI